MPNIELTAFRHTITGQVLMMTPDNATAYLKFTRAFRDQLHPQGMVEEQLAQSIADVQWRLNQVRALESNILAAEAAAYAHTVPAQEPNSQAALVNARHGTQAFSFSLYEHRLNRLYHQNLRLLRDLQQDRRQQQDVALEAASQLLTLEKSKAAPNGPLTYAPSDDGFVFSIAEIEAHIRLRNRNRDAKHFTATHSAAA